MFGESLIARLMGHRYKGSRLGTEPDVVPVEVTSDGAVKIAIVSGSAIASTSVGGTGTGTAPTAGQILVGQTGGVYAPKTMSGDGTLSAAGALTLTLNNLFGGRLTLTTGTPVTTSDVTSATTLYYTPYLHTRVPVYASSAWSLRTFAEISLALGSVTSGLPYDIFLYDSSGTLTLEKLAWTNTTTRATALARQDGVWTKSGDPTRVYLGTIYTTSTTTTEDSLQNRYVWNMYNRLSRPLRKHSASASWTNNSATFAQADVVAVGAGVNQVNVCVGLAESMIDLRLVGVASHTAAGSALVIALGEDWTSGSPTSEVAYVYANIPANNTIIGNRCDLTKTVAIGRHSYVWIERNTSGATGTFYGVSSDVLRAGITGSIDC